MISHHKIGLYGGTFDPVHHGHLILAREALEVLSLDQVIFLPAGISPHKLTRPPTPAALRCEMLAAAIEGENGFSWDDMEVRREGPSYAIDTVREMHERHPGAEFFYFIGEDNVASLHTWKDIEALKSLARFVVLARGSAEVDLGFLRVGCGIEISSTMIRNRIATGRSVRYLLPESVCNLIVRNRLYRNE